MTKKNNHFKRVVSIADEVIRSDEVLTIDAFRQRMKIGDYSWRTLRKKLPLRAVGRKLYLKGSDWLAYVQSLPPDWGDENGSGKHASLRNRDRSKATPKKERKKEPSARPTALRISG